MKNKLPTYDNYKPSNVEWLGEIPQHWEVTRVKNIFRLIVEPAPKNNDFELLSVYTDIGVKPRKELEERGNKASTTDGYWFVKKGDIVVNKLLAWMGAIGISNYDGVTSPAYDILRAKVPIESNFYHYLFRNEACISELKKHSRGIMDMRLRLYFDKFGDIIIPFPSLHEQQKIVEFIEIKTTKIDKAIDIKQRQIELLKERRQILIYRAVTRGVGSLSGVETPLKDSGVEWIGEIPEHWEVKALKFSTKIFRGKFTHRPRNDERLYDGIYPFFQTGDVARADKFLSEYKQTLNDFGLRVSTLFPKGTIVMTIAANIGDIAILDIDACFPDSIVGFNPMQFLERDFLYNSLLAMKEQFMSSTIKNTQMNLNVDRIGTNSIAIPPIEEQKAIVSHIENISAKISKAIGLKEREIEVLKEYKSSLINSAVTGKVKIG